MKPLHFLTTSDNYRIAYRLEGPSNGPVLLLANSLGTSMHMWDNVMSELTARYRILRFDIRGYSESDAPEGEYTMDRIGQDIIELLDQLGLMRINMLGLSFGGLIVQWLAINHPQRVKRLIIANSTSHLGTKKWWNQLITDTTGKADLSDLADTFLHNWFSPEMLKSKAETIESFRKDLLAIRWQGYVGTFAAHRDADYREADRRITAPTLVIAGADDPVCLPSHSQQIAAVIPGATLITLPVRHISNVERPDLFLKAVNGFLAR